MIKVAAKRDGKPKTTVPTGNFIGVCPLIGRGRANTRWSYVVLETYIRTLRIELQSQKFGFMMKESDTPGRVYGAEPPV